MTRNQALLDELIKYLDNIRINAITNKLKHYDNELNNLSALIQNSLKVSHRSSFFEKNEVVKCIMKIISNINHEIANIEVEMHGVANYSNYENSRINDIALKQNIKDDLNAMLYMVVHARPEIRDAELSCIIKMLG